MGTGGKKKANFACLVAYVKLVTQVKKNQSGLKKVTVLKETIEKFKVFHAEKTVF